MIPEGYRSPEGTAKGTELNMENVGALLAEIRAVKTEVSADIREMAKDLGAKMDAMKCDHNELQLKVADVAGRQAEKIETVEKNVTKIWSEIDQLRERANKSEKYIDAHRTEHAEHEKNGQGVAEWVRWIPGVLIALCGLAIAFIK